MNSKCHVIRKEFHLVELYKHFNNDAISYDDLKCDGDFDGNGATYPSEELPKSNSLIYVDNIPFIFPSKEKGEQNNFVLCNQNINVTPGKYTGLFVLGAVEGKNDEVFEEEVTITLEDKTEEPVYLGLSNWLLSPKYNESIAFQCSHIHVPDFGQITINENKQMAIHKHAFHEEETYYKSTNADPDRDKDNALKGIWRPRIFLQMVKLRVDKNIVKISFMDNVNFHIFSMTLEKGL